MKSVVYWPVQFSASMTAGEALNVGVVVAAESAPHLFWKIQQDTPLRVERAFRGCRLGPVAELQLEYVEAELRRIRDKATADPAQVQSLVDRWASRLANQVRLGRRGELRVVEGMNPLEHLFATLVYDFPESKDDRQLSDHLP